MRQYRQIDYLDLYSLKSSIENMKEDSKGYVTRDEIGMSLIKLEIYSSKGWFFTNGNVETQLMVVCKNGNIEITDSIPYTNFIWRRKSERTDLDKIWNDEQRKGKFIHITKNDIVRGSSTTFICDLVDDNGKIIASTF